MVEPCIASDGAAIIVVSVCRVMMGECHVARQEEYLCVVCGQASADIPAKELRHTYVWRASGTSLQRWYRVSSGTDNRCKAQLSWKTEDRSSQQLLPHIKTEKCLEFGFGVCRPTLPLGNDMAEVFDLVHRL